MTRSETRVLRIVAYSALISACLTGGIRAQTNATVDSAQAMTAAGEFEKATDFILEAIERDGESVQYLRAAALARQGAGDTDGVIDLYERAARLGECDTCHNDLDSLAMVCLRAGRLDDADEFAKRAAERQSGLGRRIVALVACIRGDQLIARYDLKGAEERFREAVAAYPDTLGYSGLLRCFYLQREKELYLKLSEELIKRYPDFHAAKRYLCDYYLDAGRNLKKGGNPSASIGVYTLCIDTDPSRTSEMALEIGDSYLKLGDTSRALEYFSNAVTDDAFAGPSALKIASVYAARGRLREAIITMQNGIITYPAAADAWESLAGYYFRSGRAEDGVAAARVAAKLGSLEAKARLGADSVLPDPLDLRRLTWFSGDPFDPRWRDPVRFANRISPPDWVPVDEQPVPVFQSPPDYPEVARRAGVEGTVWVKLLVDRSGIPTKAVVMSSDVSIFDESAVAAALRWRFTPARLGGTAVSVWAAIPFRFKMNK